MQIRSLKKNAAQVYLITIPFLAITAAFAIGHISYKIYVPIWIINVCLTIQSSWILGAHAIKDPDIDKKHLVAAGLFLIVPIMLTTIFFGIGPPPESRAEWVATATEQQVRYLILVIAGVFIALGFAVLRERLKNSSGSFYSLLGFTAIMIAIPLFIINMIFWGAYLVELFKIVVASGSEKMPEWFLPTRKLFGLISLVEVALTYLATAAFAASLNAAGIIGKNVCRTYIVISFLGFSIMALSFIEPIATVSEIASIPAIPFLIPYILGINILSRSDVFLQKPVLT